MTSARKMNYQNNSNISRTFKISVQDSSNCWCEIVTLQINKSMNWYKAANGCLLKSFWTKGTLLALIVTLSNDSTTKTRPLPSFIKICRISACTCKQFDSNLKCKQVSKRRENNKKTKKDSNKSNWELHSFKMLIRFLLQKWSLLRTQQWIDQSFMDKKVSKLSRRFRKIAIYKEFLRIQWCCSAQLRHRSGCVLFPRWNVKQK